MARPPKRGAGGDTAVEQEMREQEVLRANKELAAYFKGRRTEREARAALKIIKAFVRDRQRLDPKNRRPLPGAGLPKTAKPGSMPKSETNAERARRRGPRRRKPGKPAIALAVPEAAAATDEGPSWGE